MKKYKFRLEGALKLREFKEEAVKVEIGKINYSIIEKESEIVDLNSFLDKSYESHNKVAESNVKSSALQFYPYYNSGLRSRINQLKSEILELENLREEKIQELAMKRADVKVMEKLKDKDLVKFKKEQTKKQRQDIEDLFLITRGTREEK